MSLEVMNSCKKGELLQEGCGKKSPARRLTLEIKGMFSTASPTSKPVEGELGGEAVQKMQCFEGDEWGSAAELLPGMPCVVEPCKVEKTVGRVV